MAKEFGRLPSELLRTDWFDYQFDLSVMIIGREEEARRQDPKSGQPSKPSPARPTSTGQFANPTGLERYRGKGVNVKTMQIPESGVW